MNVSKILKGLMLEKNNETYVANSIAVSSI